MPTYYPEGNVVQAGDSHKRTLQKINSRLYDLAVATLSFLSPDSDCAPNAGDTMQRSLWKINALLNALTITPAGTGGLYSGPGSPNGVVAAAVGSQYTQTDAPGVEWVKVTGAGNTGWAVNS